MIEESDRCDVRLSRPVALVDLWDLDDRVSRLEDVVERLEKVVVAMVELYRSERVKNWEMILQEMMKKEKGNNHGNRTG